MPDNFWLLFLANLPVVAAIIWGLHKGFFVMGVTHKAELAEKDKAIEEKNKEIDFRESLRQEALRDKSILETTNRETIVALNEVRSIVTQTLDLNDRLLNENLRNRWDENDRRPSKT